jgi:hypothetical protein
MPLSMYQTSIPVFVRALGNLSAILEKAAAHAEEKKIDPSVFINARLAPDMFPLSRQVQSATDSAKGCGARLAGAEVPRYEDTESTFAELQARIDKTVAFLQGLGPDLIAGSGDRSIVLKLRGKEVSFSGQNYLFNFALPNFFFHAVTAYDILRHNGVEIGKQDFLGNY